MKSCHALCDDLLISTGNLLDKIKRLTIYGKSIDTEEILSLADICRHQLDQFYISNTMVITREEVLEGNMNKLLKGDKARYKSGSYSDDQANTRADKVEEPPASISQVVETSEAPNVNQLVEANVYYTIYLTKDEANWLRTSIPALNSISVTSKSNDLALVIVRKLAAALD